MKDKKYQIAKGLSTNSSHWEKRKMPYDFTSCLAHMDITYNIATLEILQIKGLLDHNEVFCSQCMQRLPPVPLHDHVWQVALKQLNEGAR